MSKKFEDDFFEDLTQSLAIVKSKFKRFVEASYKQKDLLRDDNQAISEKLGEQEALVQSLAEENEQLKRQMSGIRSELERATMEAELSGLRTPVFLDGKVYGITDLEKRIDEAVFDATKHFEKKCPYCGKDLYQGNIRSKIEIDHFFPIAMGGQNFPWNVLPVCKDCNRKKRDKLPFDFLEEERYRQCFEYLVTVKEEVARYAALDVAAIEIVKSIFRDNKKELKVLSTCLPVSKIYSLFFPGEPEVEDDESDSPQSDFSIATRFFSTLSRRTIANHSEYFARKDEIRIILNESYRTYRKMEKGTPVSLEQIKEALGGVSSGLISKGKPVSFRGKTKRCLVLDYLQLPQEWRALFAEYFGIDQDEDGLTSVGVKI